MTSLENFQQLVGRSTSDTIMPDAIQIYRRLHIIVIIVSKNKLLL